MADKETLNSYRKETSKQKTESERMFDEIEKIKKEISEEVLFHQGLLNDAENELGQFNKENRGQIEEFDQKIIDSLEKTITKQKQIIKNYQDFLVNFSGIQLNTAKLKAGFKDLARTINELDPQEKNQA